MALVGRTSWSDSAPISFPQWREALGTGELPPVAKRAHEQVIIAFLAFCERHQAAATIALIKDYLARLPVPPAAAARESLLGDADSDLFARQPVSTVE